jgi:hypothetical protein
LHYISTVPPSIPDGPLVVAAKENSGTILQCEAFGEPEPKIIWEKDNMVLPNVGLHYRIQKSGSLEFSKVKMNDTGSYRCRAENEAGSTEVMVDLNVLGNQYYPGINYLQTLECIGYFKTYFDVLIAHMT